MTTYRLQGQARKPAVQLETRALDNFMPKPKAKAFFFGAALFLLVVTTLIIYTTLSLSILYSALIGINLTASILCGYDKGASKGSHTRVPELVLLGVGALGGAFGLLFGMLIFRHKTRKPFMLLLIILALVHLGIVKALTN